ncbi:MAG TPA: hypothetical protein PKD54_08895, partial [Pirellulaceae bacterium]|nr:hypothetical protein [Pirellulaceae bacterium]
MPFGKGNRFLSAWPRKQAAKVFAGTGLAPGVEIQMKPRPDDKWRFVDLTQERVNRHASRQPYRLLAGLTISSDFSTVQAALVAASGRGHFLTIRHIEFVEHKLPENLTFEMSRLCESPHIHFEDMRAIALDFTGHVALAAESLKCRAGRYVDRILAVTFLEPWEAESALLQFSANAFLPHRLAELTGLNVIDRIPESDRAAGGKGFPLAGYPMWLLLADRHSSVARGPTAAILIDRDCDLYWLPSSDGLDTSPPAIQWRRIHNVWNSAIDPPKDSTIQRTL